MGITLVEHAMPETAIVHANAEISKWDQAVYAFLAEKERRSGSRRTVESYARMLRHAFATMGTTPDQVTRQDVFSWAHGVGLSGRQPSRVTVGARIACLSSFYRFLIRMGLVPSNPCDALERPKTEPSQPRGLSAADIQRLLAVIPDTRVGLRDRAIVLTLTLTGRRRAEVLGMKVGNLIREGNTVHYTYRGKGGKTGKRELPRPAYEAIVAALAAWGKDLAGMKSDESLWPSASSTKGLTSGSFYTNLQGYLKAAGLGRAGVHIFRHSAAKLRRDAGESVEQVSQFLDHSSLAVTSVYLRRLEGQDDLTWRRVAEAIGVEPVH
jgi:integrase/recombinase XerC